MGNDDVGLKAIVLVVLVVIMLIFGGGTFFCNAMTAPQQHQNALDEAHEWVGEMFPAEEAQSARVSCQATDSDSNGYVSCTLMITHDGEEQLIPIECHAYVVANYGDTCRPLTPFMMTPARRGR